MNNQYHHNQIHLGRIIKKVQKKIREKSISLLQNFLLGKQKWVPLPVDNNEGDATTGLSTNPQSSTKPGTAKGNRTGRNARNGRGGNRIRTRSLDGATPKRNRKNRTTAAAYNGYQDYYAYYCML